MQVGAHITKSKGADSWRRRFGRRRRKIVHALNPYRWVILGAFGLTVFFLGFLGFFVPNPHGFNITDSIYHSLELFTFSASAPLKGPQLEVARFLAPVVFGWAGVTAFAGVFRDRWQAMRVARMRNHVVVCGLGYVGAVFVQNIRNANERVVAIESDTANPAIEFCRRNGIPVMIGDAQLKRTLRDAGVERAARVLAVSNLDAVNTEIVSNAREIATDRKGPPLECLARITDPEFCEVIRNDTPRTPDGTALIDYFNTDDVSAQLLLDDFPITPGPPQQGPVGPHILIAHLDTFGVALARYAARDWNEKRRQNDDVTGVLTITVVDLDAPDKVEQLKDTHPIFDTACDLRPFDLSTNRFRELETFLESAPPLAHAYVTAYNDEEAVKTALQLRHILKPTDSLVVALSRAQGVARLVGQGAGGTEPTVSLFRTLEQTCSFGMVRNRATESMARAAHRYYNDVRRSQGKEITPWSELRESFKQSSRLQARHIPEKLRHVGCEIVRLNHWVDVEFPFTNEEVEQLAAMEHARYMNERRGAPPDENSDRHAEEYEALSEENKDYDRVAVRAIPAILASVGLQVKRGKSPAT